MFFESLKGRTVVITGAAGGIGVPLAHYCRQAGADLLLLDRNFEGLRKLTASLDGPTRNAAETSELEDFAECRRLLDAAPSKPIALVHLAGIFEPDGIPGEDGAVWERAIDHNLKNARNMCLAFGEAASGDELSRIVLTSSLAANRGAFDYISYSAAKAGVIGLTRALSRHYAPNTVVNCISPGIIMTGMPDRVLAERGNRVLSEIPLKRFGEPDEVARVAVFLISDAVSYMTGQTINIDGGTING